MHLHPASVRQQSLHSWITAEHYLSNQVACSGGSNTQPLGQELHLTTKPAYPLILVWVKEGNMTGVVVRWHKHYPEVELYSWSIMQDSFMSVMNKFPSLTAMFLSLHHSLSRLNRGGWVSRASSLFLKTSFHQYRIYIYLIIHSKQQAAFHKYTIKTAYKF